MAEQINYDDCNKSRIALFYLLAYKLDLYINGLCISLLIDMLNKKQDIIFTDFSFQRV